MNQDFTNRVNNLHARVNDFLLNGENAFSDFSAIQEQLRELMREYEGDKNLGEFHCKMYELQAVLQYYNEKPEDALVSLQKAVVVRGGPYVRADKIKQKILNNEQITFV